MTSPATDPAIASTAFTVNDRTYRPPARPIAVICIDGCADEYLSTSMARGCMPRTARMLERGYRGMVRAALPSFTNVNNAAIVTGAPPRVTGISGNFFLDRETGETVMMNDARYLRCETILAAAARAGRCVATVTAKQKLREILGHGLTGIAFSAENADEATESRDGIAKVPGLVGRAVPEIYSGDASVFVLAAGAALLERQLADFLYLSLTDYMQHKHAPDTPESLAFHRELDEQIGRLLDLGAIVAIAADHGMNAKNTPDGEPNVVYVKSLLDEAFGGGIEVICPITDPYVVHHGALGSLVMVHLDDPTQTEEVARHLWRVDGITEVYDRDAAVRKLELPEDRIGDLVVLSGRDVALGRTPADHDLSLLAGGLRTHGGRYEEMVPLLLSEPMNAAYARRAEADPRNFDVFAFACNGVHQS